MPTATQSIAPHGKRIPRVLGRYDTGRPGPTFVVTTGIHGNEPAGAVAGLSVLRALRAGKVPLQGRFVVLAGNLRALESRVRYFDQDLNRLWTPQCVAKVQAQDPARDTREEREQRELLVELQAAMKDSDDFVLVDLHSSSGDGAPFVCMADTLCNRRIAFAIPLPVILGLEETIDGALLDWVYEQGGVAIAVEGGRHDAQSTAANLEATLWIAMQAAGCLRKEDAPNYDAQVERLVRASRGIARVLEIRHREVLTPQDTFKMEPGFKGFDHVQRGQVLAIKNGAQLTADENSRILLPLYQGQGSDGYFLARRVRRFWLWLSARLRRLRFSRVLPLLPGVTRHPKIQDAFLVDPKLARWFSIQLFHLLGFRRKRRHGTDGKELFTRRLEAHRARC